MKYRSPVAVSGGPNWNQVAKRRTSAYRRLARVWRRHPLRDILFPRQMKLHGDQPKPDSFYSRNKVNVQVASIARSGKVGRFYGTGSAGRQSDINGVPKMVNGSRSSNM
uniref:Uncharacterized protein n=1 Tax=Anopheles atroparvus TaxID=41427 RepID=A0AAG5D7S8_ANOAO